MNNIDYNQSGGFPLSTQILDASQEAYKNFNAFGNFAGDLTIVTGCEDSSGGTVTNGFVSIYGELLPFVGTTVTDNVVIIETPDARGFEDGSVKAVIYKRYATFGSGTVEYPWANFRRPMTLFALEDRLTQLEKAVPVGLVAIWDRPADEVPLGWVEHTDLAGKTPVGHQTGDVNFGALGGNLGTAQVTLDINEIPSHRHSSSPYNKFSSRASDLGGAHGTSTSPDSGANDVFELAIAGFNSSMWTAATEKAAGGGQPHSNIQPSRIVKFIRFVGF